MDLVFVIVFFAFIILPIMFDESPMAWYRNWQREKMQMRLEEKEADLKLRKKQLEIEMQEQALLERKLGM